MTTLINIIISHRFHLYTQDRCEQRVCAVPRPGLWAHRQLVGTNSCAHGADVLTGGRESGNETIAWRLENGIGALPVPAEESL